MHRGGIAELIKRSIQLFESLVIETLFEISASQAIVSLRIAAVIADGALERRYGIGILLFGQLSQAQLRITFRILRI
ncbi:MAG: hypothetical protein BWY75_02129 [bacterium ADurb.Bin425]|nr:MAG: hypothetical protein BWY75_02129 [bacterium ADurb.Bin425]